MREPRNPNPNNMERSHDHAKEMHHMSIPISVPYTSNLSEDRPNVSPSSDSTNVTNKPTSKSQIPLNTMHKHPSTHMKIMEKLNSKTPLKYHKSPAGGPNP
jgi:hypothetical protein